MKKEKNTGILAIIMILVLTIVSLISYIIYDKVTNKDKKEENKVEEKNEIVNQTEGSELKAGDLDKYISDVPENYLNELNTNCYYMPPAGDCQSIEIGYLDENAVEECAPIIVNNYTTVYCDNNNSYLIDAANNNRIIKKINGTSNLTLVDSNLNNSAHYYVIDAANHSFFILGPEFNVIDIVKMEDYCMKPQFEITNDGNILIVYGKYYKMFNSQGNLLYESKKYDYVSNTYGLTNYLITINGNVVNIIDSKEQIIANIDTSNAEVNKLMFYSFIYNHSEYDAEQNTINIAFADKEAYMNNNNHNYSVYYAKYNLNDGTILFKKDDIKNSVFPSFMINSGEYMKYC